MTFNISRCFHPTSGLKTEVALMDYPFLIDGAFHFETGKFMANNVRQVLTKYLAAFAKAGKSSTDQLDRLIKGLAEQDSGFYADASLFSIGGTLVNPDNFCNLAPGPANLFFRVARFGNCLGLRPDTASNNMKELHTEAMSILDELAERNPELLRRFVHTYQFSVRPELDVRENSGWSLSVAKELAVMKRYLPDVSWSDPASVTVQLGDDFTEGEPDGGVVVGTYGEAEILLRITCDNADLTWRSGFFFLCQAPELVFSRRSGVRPGLQYFVRTSLPRHRTATEQYANVQYWQEQWLMEQVARMLYTALYQRDFHGTEASDRSWTCFTKPARLLAPTKPFC